MDIAERLKILREEKGLRKINLAKQMNINYTTYCNYEAGIREPNAAALKIISNFYNVSIDYILGATDIKERFISNEKNKIKDSRPQNDFEYAREIGRLEGRIDELGRILLEYKEKERENERKMQEFLERDRKRDIEVKNALLVIKEATNLLRS